MGSSVLPALLFRLQTPSASLPRLLTALPPCTSGVEFYHEQVCLVAVMAAFANTCQQHDRGLSGGPLGMGVAVGFQHGTCCQQSMHACIRVPLQES